MHADVAFLYPPFTWYDLDFKILLLRAALEARGLSTGELIRRDDRTLAAVAARVARSAPRVLVVHVGWWGAQFASLQRRWTFGLLDLVRERMPDTTIVACGELAQYAPDTLLSRCPALDACVVGDAPDALAALAAAPHTVPATRGLHTRSGPTAPAPVPTDDLDFLPTPFAGLANDANYDFTYSTAFGCPYACTYCRTRSYEGTRLRRFSVARVLDDLRRIAALYRRRPRLGPGRRAAGMRGASLAWDSPMVSGISLEDQTFTIDRERTLAICRGLAERPLGVALGCVTRADLLDAEVLRALWDAGIRGVNLGIDTLEPRALERSGRLARLDAGPSTDPAEYERRCRENVTLALEMGFDLSLSAVVGLPGATPRGDAAVAAWLGSLGPRTQLNPRVDHPGPLLATRVLEGPLPGERLEQVAVPERVEASHFGDHLDRLLHELDATAAPAPAPSPVIVVAHAPVTAAALARGISSGAHAYLRSDSPTLRAALAPLPVLALVPEGQTVSVDPEERFEVGHTELALADLVDARGAPRLEQLAAPRRHPLAIRERGVRWLSAAGLPGLRALVRLSRAARRGLWLPVPAALANAVVVQPDACGLSTGARPVAPLRRVHVRADGLAACPRGPALGAPGSRPAALAVAHEAASRAMRRELGCSKCPALAYCPACPCLAGTSAKAYCRSMRSLAPLGPAPLRALDALPALAASLTRLGLEGARVLFPAFASDRRWRSLGDASSGLAVSATSAQLVRDDAGERWVLLGRRGVIEIAAPLGRALAAALSGSAPADVLRELRKRSGLSLAAARDGLRQLMGFFRKPVAR